MPMRFRLATLLTVAPLLTIAVALGSWVLALRAQVAELERRVTVLEMVPPVTTMAGEYSDIGVHHDVDRAMQADGMINGVREELR